jgi:hypothetical protein
LIGHHFPVIMRRERDDIQRTSRGAGEANERERPAFTIFESLESSVVPVDLARRLFPVWSIVCALHFLIGRVIMSVSK